MKLRISSYWIETLGCPKNQVDSRRMNSAFLEAGFLPSSSPEKADFIVINSCAFIKEAQEETIHTIYESLKIKSLNQNRVILVGCFAEKFSEAVRKEIPELDEVIGVGRYDNIPSIISEKFGTLNAHQACVYDNIHEIYKTGNAYIDKLQDECKTHAYFRIARGCSRSCAFCAIPSIRGSLRKNDLSELKKQLTEETNFRTKPFFERGNSCESGYHITGNQRNRRSSAFFLSGKRHPMDSATLSFS